MDTNEDGNGETFIFTSCFPGGVISISKQLKWGVVWRGIRVNSLQGLRNITRCSTFVQQR